MQSRIDPFATVNAILSRFSLSVDIHKNRLVKLLHAASDKLAATPGCESLRMLKARIHRHDDD